MVAASSSAIDVNKSRDPTWIPPPCSSANSDIHSNDNSGNLSPHLPPNSSTTAYHHHHHHTNNNHSKIGESFLSDVHSVVLNPDSTTANANSSGSTNAGTASTKLGKTSSNRHVEPDLAQERITTPPPSSTPPVAPQNPSIPEQEERRYCDSNEQSRDLQSDLFLLDQAMQSQPTRQDSLIHQTATTSINMSSEIEGTDSLFGEALGRSAFTQPLFDDHNKLLSFDSNVEPQHYSSSRLSQTTTLHASIPAPSPPPPPQLAHKSDSDALELESVLLEFGTINSQNDRDLNFAKDQGIRPFNTIYGQDVHPPGSMTFGRQKKRRLSTLSGDAGTGCSVFPDGFEGPIAKRAKSEIPHSNSGMFYGERPTRANGYGDGIGGIRTGGRAYTVMNGMGMRSGAAAGGVGNTHPHYVDGGGIGPDMTTRTHTDLYENLPPELQMRVDHLREKISKMPRRKLRDSLALGVTIEEVIPLMSINRDDLAEMLGLGVTTWKIFIHKTFGIPRWPARVLKSQEMKERTLRARLAEAELRGDTHATAELWQELKKLEEKRRIGRNKLRNLGRRCREKLIAKLKKGCASGASAGTEAD